MAIMESMARTEQTGQPPREIADRGTVRLGEACVMAEFALRR